MNTELKKIVPIPEFVDLMANATDDKIIEIYNDRIRIMGTNEYVEWMFEDCKGIMLKKDSTNIVTSIKFIMKTGIRKQCCGDRIDFSKPEEENLEKFNQFTNKLFSEFDEAFTDFKKI